MGDNARRMMGTWFVAIGLFLIISVQCRWGVLVNHYDYLYFVALLGESGADIITGLFALFLIAFGCFACLPERTMGKIFDCIGQRGF